jgi:hypothetical protein
MRGRNPLLEAIRRHRMHDKVHVRETVAAELARLSVKLAGLIGLQPQLGDHTVHGRHHTAELRHKEHVHHARRSEREMRRHFGR